ncbi:MAG TPA: hypothetical protein VFV38_20445 [Ktedonobacteraceae bacterium]|nr:hypothetical protein [Ktedonobacteraceae bacterium]
MQIHLPFEMPEIVARYKEKRFVVLPQLLTTQQAQELLATTTTIPSREVICRNPHVSWLEQKFFSGMPVFELFRSAIPLVTDVLESETITKVTSWSSVYSLGKYINAHRDRLGTIQFLICLEAPPETNGGSLNLRGIDEVETSICLQPGDGLLFEARRLLHWTTPLIATDAIPNPRRTVIVGRYFA